MTKQKRGKYRKAVFIVVYSIKRDKVDYLLLKRKLHWKGWEFPKGGIEKNETFILAVKREIKEETGLKALKIKKFNEKGKYRYKKKYADRKGFMGQEYILFSAEIKESHNKKIKLDKKEHSAYKWLPYNKALKLLKWKNQKKCLRKVDKSLNIKQI